MYIACLKLLFTKLSHFIFLYSGVTTHVNSSLIELMRLRFFCVSYRIYLFLYSFFPFFCRADTSNRRDEDCNGILAYLKLKTDNSIESLSLDEEGKLCTLTEPKTDIISRE